METNNINSDKSKWFNIVVGIIIIIFSAAIACKVILFDFSKITFEKIDFSTLLSVVLALFSVALAVAFYFKASDSSNKFYDNIYKFTQDVSTTLGKIEVGFGEKLSNLNEGYRDLGQKIYHNPLGIKDNPSTSQSQEKIAIGQPTKLQKAVNLFSENIINQFKKFVIEESELNTQISETDKIAALLDYATIIYLKTHFETIYENIFGSQIALLQYLNSIPQVGDTFERLRTFYDQAVVRNPGRFEDYPFENYLDFLKRFDLIFQDGDFFKATVKAMDFLSYMNLTNKNLSKEF